MLVQEAERQAAIAKAEAEEAARRKARADQLRQAGLPVDPETLSRGDRDAAAGREKEKGNECFKAGEWEDALAFYTRAIAYAGNDKSVAVLYGNRAQARIKLKQWASCEDDCTAALAWEPRNVKCLLRRATARISRGKYREAVLDCKAVTATEKDAAMLSQATKLIIEAREKGRSAGVDVDAAQEEEDQGGGQPRQQQAAPAPAAAARRIAIEEEDDEEEDGVGQQPLQQQPQPGVSSSSALPPKPTARRMVIEEDDSSDEEEPRSATRAGRALPPPLTSRQVSAASSTPAAPSSSSTVAPSAKRMIIQEADGDDRSDTKGDGNLKPTSVAAAVKTVSRAAPPPAVPAAQVPASPAPAAATTVKAAVAANGSSTAAAVDAKSQADKEKEAGNRLFQQGQYGDAVAAYTRSLALCPGVVGVLTNRAAARLKLQQWSSAALDCTDALKAAGVTQEQVDVMAGIELGAGQGGAAASPSIAPDASATAVKALWRRAQANRENGHQEKALSDLAAALHLEPSNNKVKEELRELKLVIKTAKAGTAAATPAAATTPTPAATSSTPPSTASAVASQPAQPPVAPASPAPAAKPVPAASPSGTPTQQQPQQAGPGSPSPRKAADAVARAASAAAAALAKTAAARSSSLPPCPRTSFELEASVKSLRRDPATLLAYARQIPGQHLASIIKTPADTDMVTYLLAGLRKAIATSAAPASSSSSLDDRKGEWLVSLLDGLRRSVGFDTVARMFLGDESDDAEALLDAALAAGIGADARKLAAEVRPYFRPR